MLVTDVAMNVLRSSNDDVCLLRMSSTSQTQILVYDVVLPDDIGVCHRNISEYSFTVQVRYKQHCAISRWSLLKSSTLQVQISTICYIFVHIPSPITDNIQSQ